MAAESTETVATKKKAELIAGIDQTWATLEAALAATSEEMSTTVGRDGWSVKDHLAHIEGWERFLLAVLARQSPSGAIGIDLGTLRSTDDDTLNPVIEPGTLVTQRDIERAVQCQCTRGDRGNPGCRPSGI